MNQKNLVDQKNGIGKQRIAINYIKVHNWRIRGAGHWNWESHDLTTALDRLQEAANQVVLNGR